jgi:hypothetical protein
MENTVLEFFENNKMQYIRDICELIGDIAYVKLLESNPNCSFKKFRIKEKSKIEKKVYCKCNAFTQNGIRCTRNIYEKEKLYCGLHNKQPFGNLSIGHVRKQKNIFVEND